MKYFKYVALLPTFGCSLIFAGSLNCAPNEIGQYDSRIHIRCEQTAQDGTNAIRYFAVPITGATGIPETASRFLSVGMAAVASGKSVFIVFDDGDTSGVAYGCGATDCRKPRAFFLEK